MNKSVRLALLWCDFMCGAPVQVFKLVFMAWYLRFSCMTLFVICCSVLSFAIGLSV